MKFLHNAILVVFLVVFSSACYHAYSPEQSEEMPTPESSEVSAKSLGFNGNVYVPPSDDGPYCDWSKKLASVDPDDHVTEVVCPEGPDGKYMYPVCESGDLTKLCVKGKVDKPTCEDGSIPTCVAS